MKQQKSQIRPCMYYSKMLDKVFDTYEELVIAEEAEELKIEAKEKASMERKEDAKLVEESFKLLNLAKKTYKEATRLAFKNYTEQLNKIKDDYNAELQKQEAALIQAEKDYQKALQVFTEKHPEGYHLTLKDGDYETTLEKSSDSTTVYNDMKNILQALFKL